VGKIEAVEGERTHVVSGAGGTLASHDEGERMIKNNKSVSA